ncbi:hypothetical protein MKY34_16905 [Sporosarcina sp. FSL K6-1522]
MNLQKLLYVHNELVMVHRVTKGPNGESFLDMDYQSLVRLLAVKRAVAE